MARSTASTPVQAIVAIIAIAGVTVVFLGWSFQPPSTGSQEVEWSRVLPGPLTFVQTQQKSSKAGKASSRVQVIQLRNNENLDAKFWAGGDAQIINIDHSASWPGGKDKYIVGWKPAVEKITCPNGEEDQMVHHINIRGLLDGEHDTEDRIVASYDKGASQYRLPDGYGIRIAPGEKILVQTHYLKPLCLAKDMPQTMHDTSGLDLLVTDQKPLKEANLAGFYNVLMHIAPGHKLVDHVSRLSPDRVRNNVQFLQESRTGASLQPVDDLEILAVHLHTHDIATSKFFEILNEDGSVHFRSDEEPAGYGDEQQSFRNIKDKGWPRLELRPGQTLQQHCKFDTTKLVKNVEWGLSHGDEMCAPLLVVGGGLKTARNTLWSERDGFLLELGQQLGRTLREVVRGLQEGFQRLV